MLRVAAAAALFLAVGGIGAAVAPDCTIRGTSGRDFLSGTNGPDTICGDGERDYLSGAGGRDRLRGGGGRDTLVGGSGRDRLRGGIGRDQLFAIDGTRDVVIGGPDDDSCFADRFDLVMLCERVSRSAVTRPVAALSSSLSGAITVAEAETTGPPCGPDDPGCGKGTG